MNEQLERIKTLITLNIDFEEEFLDKKIISIFMVTKRIYIPAPNYATAQIVKNSSFAGFSGNEIIPYLELLINLHQRAGSSAVRAADS